MWLTSTTFRSLTQAQKAAGKDSVADVIQDSIDMYLATHGVAETEALHELTPRQLEVLRLIVDGATNREIAQTLGISVKTVEMHRMQLMATLDIHNVAGLVRYALRAGLIHP